MANRQFKVQLNEELIKRLEEDAERFAHKSGNTVAGEVIRDYLSFWEDAESARLKVVEGQRLKLKKPRAR